MERWQQFWQNRWQQLAWQVRRRPGIRRNTIFIAFLLLAVVITLATIEQIDRNHELELLVADRANQRAFLEQQLANRRLENQFYQSDYYLELEARRQFGLVARGESVLVLDRRQVDSRVDAWDGRPEGQPSPKRRSNWQLWWQFFWGRDEPAKTPVS